MKRKLLSILFILTIMSVCSCDRPYVKIYDGRNPGKIVICPENTEYRTCDYEMTQTSAVFRIVFGVNEARGN